MAGDVMDLHDHHDDHGDDHPHDGFIAFQESGLQPIAAEIIAAPAPAGGVFDFSVPGGSTGGGASVPALSSNPTADQTIFLDFDGHIVRDTFWNNDNGGRPIHAEAFSTDSNAGSFSVAEVERIEEIFRRVAEDFAPFDVNVTTVDPGVAAFQAGGRAIRALVSTNIDSAAMGGTGNRWFANAGGVAYVNSWNFRSDTPVWVFANNLGGGNEKFVAEAISHEVGHALGLSHDGNASNEYHGGGGSGATGWAPIMGSGYGRALTQWSRGEYSGATTTQDDVAIIANKLGYETDTVGNSISNASALAVDASGSFNVGGLISRRNDVDVYQFTTTGGEVSIAADAFDTAEDH